MMKSSFGITRLLPCLLLSVFAIPLFAQPNNLKHALEVASREIDGDVGVTVIDLSGGEKALSLQFPYFNAHFDPQGELLAFGNSVLICATQSRWS